MSLIGIMAPESPQNYKHFDRMSGRTLGYSAKVWIKISDKNDPSTVQNTKMWSIDCVGRRLYKEGRDNPDIYGDNIRPDSIEEKLYKITCSTICRNMTYEQ